jgi:hypothetical protein
VRSICYGGGGESREKYLFSHFYIEIVCKIGETNILSLKAGSSFILYPSLYAKLHNKFETDFPKYHAYL